MMKVTDIASVVEIAKRMELFPFGDNTFLTLFSKTARTRHGHSCM